MTAETAGAEPTRLQRVTWELWLVVAWVLPFGPALASIKTEDLGALIIVPASLLFGPVAALLSLWPRRMLRRGGCSTVPLPLLPLLYLHWWAAICVPLGMTSGGVAANSSLDLMLPGPLAPWVDTVLFAVGALLTLATWLLILLVALAAGDARPTDVTARRWRLAGWTAVLIPPLIVTLLVWIGLAP